MSDNLGQPHQVGGLHDHGRVAANSAYGDDQGRVIQFENDAFKMLFLIDTDGRREGNVQIWRISVRGEMTSD